MLQHCTVLIDTASKIDGVLQAIYGEESFERLRKCKEGIFSNTEIQKYIKEEENHDLRYVTKHINRSLKSMSSGERKKLLIRYLFEKRPDYLVLVNPFDSLDSDAIANLRKEIDTISGKMTIILLVTRTNDLILEHSLYYSFKEGILKKYLSKEQLLKSFNTVTTLFKGRIPPSISKIEITSKLLVNFKNVSVKFSDKVVLKNINWRIIKGEFWKLSGPNGSGKSTIISMITGDQPKAYGQDITLFGRVKGSGENVWTIKEKIGYFTPSMIDKFRGYHTLEQMIISGFYDSVGLYIKPSDAEINIAQTWIQLLGLSKKKHLYFYELSAGEKRLVMVARAMVKHPPLLILDEPTVGLDATSANIFVSLINKISNESDLAIIYVSHRIEPRLEPQFNYELLVTTEGSVGFICDPPH